MLLPAHGRVSEIMNSRVHIYIYVNVYIYIYIYIKCEQSLKQSKFYEVKYSAHLEPTTPQLHASALPAELPEYDTVQFIKYLALILDMVEHLARIGRLRFNSPLFACIESRRIPYFTITILHTNLTSVCTLPNLTVNHGQVVWFMRLPAAEFNSTAAHQVT